MNNNKQNNEKNVPLYKSIFFIVIVCFIFSLIFGIVNDIVWLIWLGLAGAIMSIILFILYYKFSPKLKKERDEQKRMKQEQDETARRKEEEKLANIRKTVILSHATLTDKDNAMTRGIVGMALIGTPGAIIGTSTAKERQTTTFLIVYNDNTRETREVENGSELYNIYVQYLEV